MSLRVLKALKILTLKELIEIIKIKLFHNEINYIYKLSLIIYYINIISKLPIIIKSINSHNINDIVTMEGRNAVSKYRELLDNGEKGFYAYSNNNVVGRAWVIEGPAQAQTFYNYYNYPLKEREIFIHYCATDTNYRGNNIYPALLSYICAEYKKKGVINAFLAVSDKNLPSIRGALKAGFMPIIKQNIKIIFGRVSTSGIKIDSTNID